MVFGIGILFVISSLESVFNANSIVGIQISAFCCIFILIIFSIILYCVTLKKFIFLVFANSRGKHKKAISEKKHSTYRNKNKSILFSKKLCDEDNLYIIPSPFLSKYIFNKGEGIIFKCPDHTTIRKLQYGLPFEKDEFFEFIYLRNGKNDITIRDVIKFALFLIDGKNHKERDKYQRNDNKKINDLVSRIKVPGIIIDSSNNDSAAVNKARAAKPDENIENLFYNN